MSHPAHHLPARASTPGYLERVVRLGRTLPRGRVTVVRVEHDDWCALLQRRGPCTCTPDITIDRNERAS